MAVHSVIPSWDRLDNEFLPPLDGKEANEHLSDDERGRRRVFHRIFRQGHDPERVTGNVEGLNLVEVVHRKDEMAQAKLVWDSKLWTIVGPIALSEASIESTFRGLLDKLDLYHANISEISIDQLLAGSSGGLEALACPDRDAFALRKPETVEKHARNIATKPSFDVLAVLCCAFRVAMNRVALEEAASFREAIRICMKALQRKWPADVVDSLSVLVELRAIRRDYRELDARYGSFELRQRGKRKLPAASPIFSISRSSFESDVMPPVVRKSPAITRFLDNLPEARERLVAQEIAEMSNPKYGHSKAFLDDARAVRQTAERTVDTWAITWPW